MAKENEMSKLETATHMRDILDDFINGASPKERATGRYSVDRTGPTDWLNERWPSRALALGLSVDAWFHKSMLINRSTSTGQKHRVTQAEFIRRVADFVYALLPRLDPKLRDDLEQRLDRSPRYGEPMNCNPDMLAAATRYLFQPEQLLVLERCGIQPHTANGTVRDITKPKRQRQTPDKPERGSANSFRR